MNARRSMIAGLMGAVLLLGGGAQAFATTATVTGVAHPASGGSVTGGGSYLALTNVQISAAASNGWQFTSWNDGTTNNPYTITVPATNITYTANFVPAAMITQDNGSAAGGNIVTIFYGGLGSGSDITNVMICGIAAAIQGQTANAVTVLPGAGGKGPGDIRISSASRGATVIANGYTYDPAGCIGGAFYGWQSVSNLSAPLSYLTAASAGGKVYALGGYFLNTTQTYIRTVVLTSVSVV